MTTDGMLTRRRRLRREITEQALVLLGGAAASAPFVPARAVGSLARTLTRIPLRALVARRMTAALGGERGDAARRYFDGLAMWAELVVRIYQHGWDGAGAGERLLFDESFDRLVSAHDEGRGVVLAGPHHWGHEAFAALISRRIAPVSAIVRVDERRRTLLLRWYARLGLDVLERPSLGRVQGDLRATLRRLRGGGIVGITPDVPATPAEGIPVTICGRTVHLRSGAFWLARYSGAPLVGYRIELDGRERLLARFGPAEKLESDADVPLGLERWTAAFDRALHESPESWMFWLDRRWARRLAPCEGRS